jgi:hypothetical protein
MYFDLQLFVQSVPKCMDSNPFHGEVYSIQHYVIKFVSDLRLVGGFHQGLRFPPPDHNEITEILLKVTSITINQITYCGLNQFLRKVWSIFGYIHNVVCKE